MEYMNVRWMMDYRKRKAIRRKLVKKQWGKCYYCNISFWLWETRATIDHLIPFCQVWHDTKKVACCHKCNIFKGDISEELYKDGYICVNIKPGYDLQSYNQPMKVRNPIKWYQWYFPRLFWWNTKFYKITHKIYEI